MSSSTPNIISFDTLYHVGSLNPEHKGKQGNSIEGAGLSVSLNPEEWRSIARLGDAPIWVLEKPGNKFLNAHSLDNRFLKNMYVWAKNNNLIEQTTIYRVCWYDDEFEEEYCMQFDNYKDAEAEAEGYDTDVEVISSGIKATEKMNSIVGFPVEVSLVSDLLMTIYAEAMGLDGVWWEDTLDPSKYSAPRGVIVPSQVSSWNISRIDETNITEEINEIQRRAGITLLEEKMVTVWHITDKKNIPSIMKQGLKPQVGDKSKTLGEKDKRIYVFPNILQAEEALSNWWYDYTDSPQALLKLNVPSEWVTQDQARWEATINRPVPPQMIKVVHEDISELSSLV